MPASPAVILANIPPFLRSNGKVTAIHVLGSKTGVEVGACYWKLHQTQPRFMVVFKKKVDRDNWYNTSMKLQEMKMKGVLVSTAWYSRDIDEVISEEEGQALDSGGRGKKGGGGGNYMKLLQERDKNAKGLSGRDGVMKPRIEGSSKKMPSPFIDFKTTNRSVDNMSALSAGIEDLSKMATSQFLFAQKNKLEKLVKSPFSSRQPPAANPSEVPAFKKAEPAVAAPSYNLRSSHVDATTLPSSVVNLTQDFSVPPPPLRLPLHVKPVEVVVAANASKNVDGHKAEFNSNILTKLEESVLDSLEQDKENKIDGNVKHISMAVANSWMANIEYMEKVYEAILSDASPNVSKLSEDLAKYYHWEGMLGVTREQALGWTEEFLVKAGMRAGSDMEERFAKFLVKNSSLSKISIDEIKFIMQRNGLDINSICKAFSENSSSVGFRNFVKTSVSISGHLLDDFAGVFLQFFKSKMNEQNFKSSRFLTTPTVKLTTGSKGTKMNAKGDSNEVKFEVHIDKLIKLLAINDVKGIKHVVNEIAPRMKKLASQNEVLEGKINDLMITKNKLETEVKLNKEEYHEKIRTANQENKMLRVRNTTLHDELRTSKEEMDKAKSKSSELTIFVQKFNEAVFKGDSSVEQLLEMLTTGKDDNDICTLKTALGVILSSKIPVMCQGEKNMKSVKLIAWEDFDNKIRRSLEVSINEENLVDLNAVENLVGKKVNGIKVKQGKGWKNLKVDQGLIYPPATGWCDLEYLVVTQDEDVTGHLGQGCISTPGHSRRQESTVREGPMFPPHLGGPRISTV